MRPLRGCVQRGADVVREQAVGACGHAPDEGPQALTFLFLLLCVSPREVEGRSVNECLHTQTCTYQFNCAGDASRQILYTRSLPPERSDYTSRPASRASRRPGAGATGRRLSGSASPLASPISSAAGATKPGPLCEARGRRSNETPSAEKANAVGKSLWLPLLPPGARRPARKASVALSPSTVASCQAPAGSPPCRTDLGALSARGGELTGRRGGVQADHPSAHYARAARFLGKNNLPPREQPPGLAPMRPSGDTYRRQLAWYRRTDA